MTVLLLTVAACDREGPAERVGESIDHAADTLKNGGKEPLRNRVDDAVDELRDQ